ncbi:hypothetical protein LIER_16217 [Lithospermum erythrorhizon]|uniref:Aminotransferase-like plant mobile domain-containing protein n=1 Tax=Lithospermum erythrorhizon TaxID=34254 RepID=A0AAV3QB64_LITER
MSFGEMTITLHDVNTILGLNINGFTRLYWYLLGSTLFPDKTQDSVPKGYLDLLHDMEGIVLEYAWGAVTLAYLFHQLGMASRYKGVHICSCLTLLECWIYEYFRLQGNLGEFRVSLDERSSWVGKRGGLPTESRTRRNTGTQTNIGSRLRNTLIQFRTLVARIAGQTSPEYTKWHAMIIHPRVHNPDHGPSDVYLELFSVTQQALEDPNVPYHVRASLHNMNRYAGTGGFSGEHPTPMHHWWGQPDRFPEEQYRQLVQQVWSAYPGYEYGNLPINPDDENSE